MKKGQKVRYTSGEIGTIVKPLSKGSKEFKRLNKEYENTFGLLWTDDAVGYGNIYRVKLKDGDILAYEDELEPVTVSSLINKPRYMFGKW